MDTPREEIKQLADMVTEEWGETETANVVYEWLETATGGSMNDIAAIKALAARGENNVAMCSEYQQALNTLLAEVERLTGEVSRLMEAGKDMQRQRDSWREETKLVRSERDAFAALASERDAQAADLDNLRSYVHALERYVPEAARRVAAGEARAALEQQGEGV